jgi:hypothetical protein
VRWPSERFPNAFAGIEVRSNCAGVDRHLMVLVRSQVVLTDRRDIDGEGTEDVLVSWASPIRTARAKRARHTSYSDGPQA